MHWSRPLFVNPRSQDGDDSTACSNEIAQLVIIHEKVFSMTAFLTIIFRPCCVDALLFPAEFPFLSTRETDDITACPNEIVLVEHYP